jgi:hypothetical protein
MTVSIMTDAPDILPCTVREKENCGRCELDRDLNCRWRKDTLYAFVAVASPTFIATLALLVIIGLQTGSWWGLIGYFILIVLYFLIAEIRFLCSHCPYYSRPGMTLHCIGNNGAIRIWKYNPAPMKPYEKAAMILLVLTFYVFIPVIGGIYAVWMVWTAGSGLIAAVAVGAVLLLALASSIAFYLVMQAYGCRRCVNFSCPLNRVEKEVVDAYLAKNDVMRAAWEKAGYKPGS